MTAVDALRRAVDRMRTCAARERSAHPVDRGGFMPAIYIIRRPCSACGAGEDEPCRTIPPADILELVADAIEDVSK